MADRQTDNPPEMLTICGTTWCPDCKRSKQFLGDQRDFLRTNRTLQTLVKGVLRPVMCGQGLPLRPRLPRAKV